MKEGWKFLFNAKKAHYFRDGKSLCNKWLCFAEDLEEDNFKSKDDCKICRNKIEKEKGIK